MTEQQDNAIETETETEVERFVGCVKWFDNKKGYGIISIMELQHKNEDVFAHHTEVTTKTQQYRYLVAGEYVTCEVTRSVNKSVKFSASGIKGILGGNLMCETLREQRTLKDAYDNTRRSTRVEPDVVSVEDPKPVRTKTRVSSSKPKTTRTSETNAVSSKTVVHKPSARGWETQGRKKSLG